MNRKHISYLSDDELREHFKQHPVDPDPRYSPSASALHEHVKQDLLAALNTAIHQDQLDIDALPSNIRNAKEYADKILGRPDPDAYTLGVHSSWTVVSWARINGAGIRIYTIPYASSSPGLNMTSVPLPSDLYPDSVVAYYDAEWWGWVHPRWRWVFHDDDTAQE